MYTKKTIYQQVLSNSEIRPNALAMVCEERETTYKNLDEKVKNLSAFFLRNGLSASDRIAYALRASDDFVITVLSASLCKASVAGLPYKCSPEAASVIISELKAKFLVCEKGTEDQYGFLLNQGIKVFSIEDVIGERASESELDELSSLNSSATGDEDLLILFTSGTTKKPKAAVLTNKNMLSSSYLQNKYVLCPDLKAEEQKYVSCFPVNHVSGAIESSFAPLCSGGMVLFAKKFDPVYILSMVQKYRLTVLPGVPVMWQALLMASQSGKFDLSSVELCVSGASVLSHELAQQIRKISPRLLNPLGMTETCGFCSYSDNYGTESDEAEGIGKIIPGIDYKVVDSNMKEVPQGEIGVICYRGNSVISRYLNAELVTTPDGYLYSGDLVKEDSKGRITLMGRVDDMFMCGGFNVYPNEVEEVLRAYPGVKEAIVVPISHHSMGNVCKAYITVKDGFKLKEEDIVSYAEKELMYYKVPRNIEFIEQMPVNALGKPDRKVFMSKGK